MFYLQQWIPPIQSTEQDFIYIDSKVCNILQTESCYWVLLFQGYKQGATSTGYRYYSKQEEQTQLVNTHNLWLYSLAF